MSKRHLFSGMTPPPPKADGHLSDDWLLLSIDGELSPSDYSEVKEHVRACWTCRARKEQLEKTIKEIVEYEHALVAPDMPPSPGGKAIFMARLDELPGELGGSFSIRRRVMGALHAADALFNMRAAWAIPAALGLTLVLYFAFTGRPHVFTANQLLNRAATSTAQFPGNVRQPVTIQKVGVTVGHRKVKRTLYRDSAHKRQASRTDVSTSEEQRAEGEFARSSFPWDDPLSPQAFSRWRDGIGEKRDVVTELTGGLLRLDTSASSGPVAEASLTVRAEDYHPIAEDLRLRDNTQIEVAELSYEVVGLAALPAGIFGTPVPAVEPVRLPSIHSLTPDSARTAVSEIQVRTVLHNIGADLGEQIAVRPLSNGLIRVDGVTQDEARKQQIDDALRLVPHTQIHVITVAEASARQQTNHTLAMPNSVTLVTATPPLLDEQLKKRFPGADQRTEYVNQALALCQSASARAWALNRLADRYTPQQVTLLNPEAQHQLQSLLADHISALREDVSRLQNQLGQVLSSASNTAAANTALSADLNNQPDDWRARARRVHSSIETTNEAVSVLLTGSSETNDSTDKLELRLRTTLTQLEAELQSLDQQIHKQL